MISDSFSFNMWDVNALFYTGPTAIVYGERLMHYSLPKSFVHVNKT